MHAPDFRIGRVRVMAGLAVVPLLWASSAWAETRSNPVRAVESPLQPVAVQEVDHVTRLSLDEGRFSALRSAEHLALTGFPLGPSRRVDLALRRVKVLAPDARIVVATEAGESPAPPLDVVLFSGQVSGRPDSTVFLGFSPHGSNGLLLLGDETFILSSGPPARGANAVIYDLSALPPGTIQWRDWRCRADELQRIARGPAPRAAAGGPGSTGGMAEAVAASRLVQLAIETDWEFTGTLFGGDTNASGAYAVTLIGAVSEIYMRDLDSQLEISYLRLWSTSNDPWDQNNTIDQLVQFRDYWNTQQTGVGRHLAHFLSGRPLGGGVAYLNAICVVGFDYGLSADLAGSFPYPLQDNHPQNWDLMVVAHEMGHNFGGPHTHDMTPPIDNCAGGDCSVTPHGTIMSYCHLCPGGMTNIELRFHPRMIDEEILPFLLFEVGCDLSSEPATCPVASRPLPGPLPATNRFLAFSGGNPGLQTAIRVTLVSLPQPFDAWDGTTLFAGPPQQTSENSGHVDPAGAPDFPTFWRAPLVCEENAYWTDWSTLGNVTFYHRGLVPGGLYAVEEIQDGCDLAVEANYSLPLLASTSRWGDVVKDCTTLPCGAPNGLIDVFDTVALVDKFANASGSILKARADLQPDLPDGLVDIIDVLYSVEAFAGRAYPFPAISAPCSGP